MKTAEVVTEVDSLKNMIEQMKQDHANEIVKIKADHEAQLTTEINKIRSDERANLAKVVATDSVAGGDVKTLDDFKSKHIVQK